MENVTKKISDAKILQNVIDALGMTPNAFSKELKYLSSMSIYNILGGSRPISHLLINKIELNLKNVNIDYLLTGKGKPLKETSPKKPIETIEDINESLKNIELILEKIKDKLKIH